MASIDEQILRTTKEIVVKFTETTLPTIRQRYPWLEEIDYEVFAGMVVMQLTGNLLRVLVKQAPGLMHYTQMKNQTDHLSQSHTPSQKSPQPS